MHAATPAAPEPNSTGGNGGGWPTASGGIGSATTGDGTVSNCRAGAARRVVAAETVTVVG